MAATGRPAFLAVALTLESSCIESDGIVRYEGAALFRVKQFCLDSQTAPLECDKAYGLRSYANAQNQAPTSSMVLLTSWKTMSFR